MADTTCAGCGCVCDDGLTCALGDAWFDLGERPPLARVDGREVSLDEAVAAAAAILRAARAPLVYGLGQTSIEAQRRAVGLAEALGAVIDTGGASPFAHQTIGSSTATFGEIRDRAELVVCWRADPARTHPRLLERLRVAPESLVVVDATRTATAEPAGTFIALGDDVDALWALRARVASAPLHTPASDDTAARGAGAPLHTPARDDDTRGANAPLRTPASDDDTPGASAPALDDLARRLLAARHVAFIHGALDELAALALAALVRDLQRDRHAVTLALRADGNARGAEDVLAWQTGFAGAVSFARGHPREAPSAATLLERGDVDAVLVVAAEPPAALGALPTVVIDPRGTALAAQVAIAPAADGIEVMGTVHRMDGVPLPLRAPRASDRPSVEQVLAALGGHV